MINEALTVFSLPYVIEGTTDADNYTLYRLRATGAGATLNRLKARLNDLKAYTGQDMTIQADAGGVALRVEKTNRKIFFYSDYCGHLENSNKQLPFLVGLSGGGVVVDDLVKTPHLLIAGTTGSGKSSFLHTFILSMFEASHKKPMHIYLIDCKRVEFSIYNKYVNVFDDLGGASSCVDYLVKEIERKYEAMRAAGVNNFVDYMRVNPSAAYDVLVVDELADLISTKEAQKKLIPKLLRIAQIGRAAGVHMVLATQRPDTTVINGTLKGNIPARIAFNVASRFDSQVIIDRTGAETLTGNGDGLYLRNGARDLLRFQSTFVSMDQLKRSL